MRKIDLTPYQYETRTQNEHGQMVRGTATFDPREELKPTLLSGGAGLSGEELIRNAEIVQAMREAEGDDLLLEEAQWKAMVDTLNRLRGFGAPWVTILQRIYHAPQVQVKEA